MFIYAKLKKQIELSNPKTITVDVFDTILLRKNRSEQWHFWKYSKFASNVFKTNKLSCSALLYFSLRNYYNYLLRSANLNTGKEFEASIDSLNKKIITEVAKRNNKKLTNKDTDQLIRQLVEAELKFESSQLVVNNKLVTVLSESELPVYFLTDMYFSSHQIAELFQLLGVSLSVNGLSSADHNLGKSNGKSFIKLRQKYPNIHFKSNLHIGDHRVADVQAAKNTGMMVFWVNLPLHRLKLLLSQYFLGIVVKLMVNQALHKTNSSFKKEITKGLKSNNLEHRAKAVGKLFGPAVLHYCNYFAEFANATGKTPIFVSGESYTLSRFCKELGCKNVKTLPKFGRKKLLQSYVYQQRIAGVPYWASLNMVSKVQRRKGTIDALVTLGIIDRNDTTYHLLGKNAYKEYIAENSRSIDQKLKKVYESTLKEFSEIVKKDRLDSIILGDVGWNNTIQILLAELLKNDGYSGEMTGLYMGLTGSNVFSSSIKTHSSGLLFNSLKGTSMYLYQPEVWESFLNTDNNDSSIREAILDGISESIKYYSKTDLSSRDLYKAGRSVLIKHLADPNKKIIQVFSQLMFDYGTGNEALVPMVNTMYPKYFAYRLLLRDRPRFKQFYYNQGWKWGAASWYHFRLIYRVWRKIKHKPSF